MALVVATASVVAVVQSRAAQTLAEVENLADAGQLTEALELAEQVEAVYPGDTTLARLLPGFSFTLSLDSDPRGARVFMQEGEGEGQLFLS